MNAEQSDGPSRPSRGRDGDAERPGPLPINWPAVSSLLFGSVGVLFAVQFFPAAILCGVIGGFLGERGMRFANEQPGHPGRGLAWWAVGICAITFALSLTVALQAQVVLTDPELLREALERIEASEAA